MSQPYQVQQAYDRTLIKEIAADDPAALEARLQTAFGPLRDSDGALKPYQRSAILIRAAGLLSERLDAFARLVQRDNQVHRGQTFDSDVARPVLVQQHAPKRPARTLLAVR